MHANVQVTAGSSPSPHKAVGTRFQWLVSDNKITRGWQTADGFGFSSPVVSVVAIRRLMSYSRCSSSDTQPGANTQREIVCRSNGSMHAETEIAHPFYMS